MSEQQRDKARALREFGASLIGFGKRMRNIAPRQLESEEVVTAIRRANDDLRAALDEITAVLGVDN